jgi:sodium/pantothenate symporter
MKRNPLKKTSCCPTGQRGVSAIGSVVSKKLSATGARWSMIAGFVGFIVTKCLVGFHVGLFATVFINFLDPFFIGIYLSLFFAILGSKLHPVTEEEKHIGKNF